MDEKRQRTAALQDAGAELERIYSARFGVWLSSAAFPSHPPDFTDGFDIKFARIREISG
jgi:hypothetical protein